MIESISGHTPIIHPGAFVHTMACVIGQVEIESGASIWPGVVLRGDMGAIKVGANTSVQDGTIGHMTSNYSSLSIGANVTIGHGVILHGCTIEDGCLIGMGSTILDRAIIGRASFVAATSLITGNKEFAPESFIQGSPAKFIRKVCDKEKEVMESSVTHYLNAVKLYS